LLVYAAKMIQNGLPPRIASDAAVIRAMADDPEMQEAIKEIVTGIF
jgi:CbbQ/NirQ/NorQ-like protein